MADIYIRPEDQQNYQPDKLETSSDKEMILQNIEIVLFTNKGEIYGDPNFGADLKRKLWQTRASVRSIEADIKYQLNTYVPEINGRFEVIARIFPPGVVNNGGGDGLVLEILVDNDSFIFVV